MIEHVKCLSVNNLADDATPRELHILFSGCPGYTQCYLAFDSVRKRMYGVVMFTSEQDAKLAKRMRAYTTWDAEHPPIDLILGRPATLDNARVRIVARTNPAMVKHKPGRDLKMVLAYPEVNQSPSANLARLKLKAAIERHRIPDLNDAIAEGERANLPEEDLNPARKLRHDISQRMIVNHVASAKRKAKAMLEQMRNGGTSVEDVVDAVEEAEKLSSAAGFVARQGGGQFAPWDTWKIAIWSKIKEALKTNNVTELKDIITECEAADLIMRMPELRRPLREAYDLLVKEGLMSPPGSRLDSPKSPRSSSPSSPRANVPTSLASRPHTSPTSGTPATSATPGSPQLRSATHRHRNASARTYSNRSPHSPQALRRNQASRTVGSPSRGISQG